MNKNMPIAHPLHRLLAGLIDALLSWSALFAGLWLISTTSQAVDLMPNIMNALLLLFVSPLLSVVITPFLMSRVGGGIGKLVSGIVVINEKGNFLTFWQAVFRNTVGYMISSSLLGLGFAWIFISKERQGWHDMISNDTVVVKQATGLVSGIVALVIVLGINIWMINSAVGGFTTHASMYEEVFSQVEQEVEELEKKEAETPKNDQGMLDKDYSIDPQEDVE